MPELPEVETTRRGISPFAEGKRLTEVRVRNHSLRWPIPNELPTIVKNHKLNKIHRRGKYLLFEFNHGHMIIHLGMSGSIRIVDAQTTLNAHDHVDLRFGEQILRFNDPRRFGCVLWTGAPIAEHELLAHLGPEPLENTFDADYLYKRSRKRSQGTKTFLMDSRTVVGVGNIYANEALFNAGVHPLKPAGKLSLSVCEALVCEIKAVLSYAIERGGTTLRDFVGGDGKPGYFAQELNVYGRGGEPCKQCGKPLTEKRIAQRTSVYCTHCQRL